MCALFCLPVTVLFYTVLLFVICSYYVLTCIHYSFFSGIKVNTILQLVSFFLQTSHLITKLARPWYWTWRWIQASIMNYNNYKWSFVCYFCLFSYFFYFYFFYSIQVLKILILFVFLLTERRVNYVLFKRSSIVSLVQFY